MAGGFLESRLRFCSIAKEEKVDKLIFKFSLGALIVIVLLGVLLAVDFALAEKLEIPGAVVEKQFTADGDLWVWVFVFETEAGYKTVRVPEVQYPGLNIGDIALLECRRGFLTGVANYCQLAR
jgi:hypothetical protein